MFNNPFSLSNQASDDEEPNIYQWPKSHLGSKLKLFEESLLCCICNEYYENPMTIQTCGHTFCSLCIRKHMDSNYSNCKAISNCGDTSCPKCFIKIDTSSLKSNRTFANVILLFRSFRNDLLNLIRNSNVSSKECTSLSHHAFMVSLPEKIPIQKLTHKSFHDASIEKLKKELESLCQSSQVKIDMRGTKEDLKRKYREIVHLNNAQIGSPMPMSLSDVIQEVNRREHARCSAAKLDLFTSNKVEKIKQGKVYSDVENGFKRLVKSIRHNKNVAADQQFKDVDTKADTPLHIDNTEKSFNLPSGCASQSVDHSDNDLRSRSDWKVVMSEKLQRPFFFNVKTGIGQFSSPVELNDNDVDIFRCLDCRRRLDMVDTNGNFESVTTCHRTVAKENTNCNRESPTNEDSNLRDIVNSSHSRLPPVEGSHESNDDCSSKNSNHNPVVVNITIDDDSIRKDIDRNISMCSMGESTDKKDFIEIIEGAVIAEQSSNGQSQNHVRVAQDMKTSICSRRANDNIHESLSDEDVIEINTTTKSQSQNFDLNKDVLPSRLNTSINEISFTQDSINNSSGRTCRKCTYENPSNVFTCEICGHLLSFVSQRTRNQTKSSNGTTHSKRNSLDSYVTTIKKKKLN